jgi:hypothetical protein
MQVHPLNAGPPEDFQGRRTATRCTLAVTLLDFALLISCNIVGVNVWLLKW